MIKFKKELWKYFTEKKTLSACNLMRKFRITHAEAMEWIYWILLQKHVTRNNLGNPVFVPEIIYKKRKS